MTTITADHRHVYGNLVRGLDALIGTTETAKVEALQALAAAAERVLVVEPSDYTGLLQVRLLSHEEAADAALAMADTDDLLTKFAALTHRIHAADDATYQGEEGALERAIDHRAARDLIRQEILRRTGDA